MRGCHSTLPVIAHDGNTVCSHLEATSLDMLMTPLPAACMVLWFSMFELKVCFCAEYRSYATEMPTWASWVALCACEASPPHIPEEQLPHTQGEMKMGHSADSTIWNQDHKRRRCNLTWDITRIQTAGDPHRGQQDLAVGTSGSCMLCSLVQNHQPWRVSCFKDHIAWRGGFWAFTVKSCPLKQRWHKMTENQFIGQIPKQEEMKISCHLWKALIYPKVEKSQVRSSRV